MTKELRLLGCPAIGPHELRLQAYREVFEYLIEDFKTYKGLLSAIKNEYELYLDYQEEVIKELKPMRVRLIFLSIIVKYYYYTTRQCWKL